MSCTGRCSGRPDISLAGNSLQIHGKRDREQEHDEGTVHTYERSYGSFTRSFALPDAADLDKIKCDLKDGVLDADGSEETWLGAAGAQDPNRLWDLS